MFIESIEGRCLLSATLGDDGVLTVTGDANNNVVNVLVNHRTGKVAVVEANLTRSPSGRPVLAAPSRTTFDLADVESVVVNAGDGNDVVSLGGLFGATTLPGTLNGEAGNDILRGGRGDDVLGGGGGNDLLAGGAGDDNLDGGEGNDVLNGGPGADTLTGGTGDDRLSALDTQSDDVLDGGEGDDKALVDADDSVTNVETVRRIRRIPRAPR